jgi:hypothetical protein
MRMTIALDWFESMGSIVPVQRVCQKTTSKDHLPEVWTRTVYSAPKPAVVLKVEVETGAVIVIVMEVV